MRARSHVLRVTALLALLCCPLQRSAAVQNEPGLLPDFDSRYESGGRPAVRPAPPDPRSATALERLVASKGLPATLAGLLVSWNPLSGTPQTIYSLAGPLAFAPAPLPATGGGAASRPGVSSAPGAPSAILQDPHARARGFLAANLDLLGWEAEDLDGLVPDGALTLRDGRVAVFRKDLGGLEVFQAAVKVVLGPEGEVQALASSAPASLAPPDPPALTALDALRRAAAACHPGLVPDATPIEGPTGTSRRTLFAAGPFDAPVPVELVVFPLSRAAEPAGRLQHIAPRRQPARLAWRVTLKGHDHRTWYEVLVDARTGAILHRFNLYRYLAPEGAVCDPADEYPLPEGEFVAPSNFSVRPFPAGPGSLDDWFDTTQFSLSGNNVRGWRRFTGNPGPVEPGQSFVYPFGSFAAGQTNLFHLHNVLHDHFHGLGFDEASKNFQQNNFGLGGVGGDPVQGNARASGRNNANFGSSGVDGDPPETNMFVWDCESCPDADGIPENAGELDGDYDHGVIVHEFCHGVSNRLVGSGGCVGGTQAGAMGEAWGDFYASSIYDNPTLGDYAIDGPGFIRTAETSWTYADLCNVGGPGCAPHRDGQIWYATLWDLRQSLVALLGLSAGRARAEQIVLDGMKLTPCSPSFLQARDAILQAEQNRYGGIHRGVIWQVFASRGMGMSASTTGNADPDPVPAFDVPAEHACAGLAAPAGLAAAPDGPNRIAVSWTPAPGSGGIEVLRRSSPSDPFVRVALVPAPATGWDDDTVQGGLSYAYALRAYEPLGLRCSSAQTSPAAAVATGDCARPPAFAGLAAAVSAPGAGGACGVQLDWSAGVSGCPAAPGMRYSVYRSEDPLFVPDASRRLATVTGPGFRDESIPSGATAWYIVRAEDATSGHGGPGGGNADANLLRRPATPTGPRTVLAAWDFEAGNDEGWTTSADPPPAGMTSAGFWQRAVPNGTVLDGADIAPGQDASAAGQIAWVTQNGAPGEAAGVSDIDNGPYRLTSPVFDGTGSPNILVSWSRWWVTTGPSGDLFRAEIDNGEDPPVALEELHSTRRPWTRVEYALRGRVRPTATMRLRFIVSDRPNNSIAEAGVDDVRVESAPECVAADVTASIAAVDDTDPARGNGNGRADAGETVALTLAIHNAGAATAPAVEVALVSAPPGVTILNPHAEAGDVAAFATVPSLPPRLAVSIPSGYPDSVLDLELEVIHAAGRARRTHVRLPVGRSQTLFVDDFEVDRGWTLAGCEGDGTLRHGKWERGLPVGTADLDGSSNPYVDSADAGQSCLVTGNGGGGPLEPELDDVDDCSTIAVSPLFSAAGMDRVRLEWSEWLTNSQWTDSFVRVEASANGGGSWAVAAPDRHDQWRAWTARQAELSTAVPPGGSMRIRFTAADVDLASNGLVEAGIDDVRIVGHDLHTDAFTAPARQSPLGIGASLRVDPARGPDLRLSWSAPPVDGLHDAASAYRIYRSTAPAAGFALIRASLETESVEDDGLSPGPAGFYRIVAENPGGTSGDEPAP